MAFHCRLQLQINDDKLAAIGEMFHYDKAMKPLVNRISLSFARKNAKKLFRLTKMT